MFNNEDITRITGGTAYDPAGDKVGSVGAIYTDDETGAPTWATINTGLFGMSESFVPLSGAQIGADGDLQLAYDKSLIKDAPRVGDEGHITPEDEDRLYTHYQVGGDNAAMAGNRTDRDGDLDLTDRDRDGDRVNDPNVTAGTRRGDGDLDLMDRDGDGDRVNDPNVTGGDRNRNLDMDADRNVDVDRGRGDDGQGLSVTRSEERLRVGTEAVETGRVRLRKYVTTEEQTVTVPVQKEVLSVERTPLAEGDANVGPISDTGEVVEEIVLREERPVVQKETVAVEQVNIGKQTVSEEQQVTEQVAKEHIDVDGDGDLGNDANLREAGGIDRDVDPDARRV